MGGKKTYIPYYFYGDVQNIEVEGVFFHFLSLCDTYENNENG